MTINKEASFQCRDRNFDVGNETPNMGLTDNSVTQLREEGGLTVSTTRGMLSILEEWE